MTHSFWCKTLIFKLVLSVFVVAQSTALFCSQQTSEHKKTKEEFEKKISDINKKIQELNRLTKSDVDPTPENNEKLKKLRSTLLNLIREKSKLNSPKPKACESVNEEKEEGEQCPVCRKQMKKNEVYTFHIHKHIKRKQKMDGNKVVKDKDGNVVMEDDLDANGKQQEILTPHNFHKECLWEWFTTSGTNAALCPSCADCLPEELEKLFKSYKGSITSRLFLTFCRAGLTTYVKKCLEDDGSLATCWEPDTEITPLHEAAAGGHIDLARLLLEYGGRPTLYDASGMRPYDLVPRDKVALKTLLAPTRLQAWNHWFIEGCNNHRFLQSAQDQQAQLVALGFELVGAAYGTLFFRPKSWRILYEGFFGTKLRTFFTTMAVLGIAAYLGSCTDRGGIFLNRMAPTWFDDPVELRRRAELIELYQVLKQAQWGAFKGSTPPSQPLVQAPMLNQTVLHQVA